MRSFEQIPRDLLLDARVPVGARLMYPMLRYLAWRNGRENENDAVELPPLPEIAGALGVAESTARSYVSDLRDAGWIETRRASRKRPMLYVIYDDCRAPKIGGRDRRKSADPEQPSLLVLDKGKRTAPTERSSDVPKLALVDGQNLALNALLDVCGISPRGNRVREAAAALANGGPNLDHGIRELAWQAMQEGRAGPKTATGEEFERWLAAMVVVKAERYRRAMPGAMLTPFALAKYWTDVDSVTSRDPATALALEAMADLEAGR